MSGSALEKLSPSMPYMYTSDAGSKYCIESLSDIYASKICGSKTRTLMAEFKNVAKMSGKQYVEILQEMMDQITVSVPELQTPAAYGAAAGTAEPPKPASHVTVKQSDSPSISEHATQRSNASAETHRDAPEREREVVHHSHGSK